MAVDCRNDHHRFAVFYLALMLELLENIDQPRTNIKLLHLVAAGRAYNTCRLLALAEGIAGEVVDGNLAEIRASLS